MAYLKYLLLKSPARSLDTMIEKFITSISTSKILFFWLEIVYRLLIDMVILIDWRTIIAPGVALVVKLPRMLLEMTWLHLNGLRLMALVTGLSHKDWRYWYILPTDYKHVPSGFISPFQFIRKVQAWFAIPAAALWAYDIFPCCAKTFPKSD